MAALKGDKATKMKSSAYTIIIIIMIVIINITIHKGFPDQLCEFILIHGRLQEA